VDILLGDSSKALRKLNWKHTTSFIDLVKEMVLSDLQAIPLETDRRIGEY
jgi:GDPmannose 4,6-dehydratase